MKFSWPMKKLGLLCDLSMGFTPARANPKFWGAGYNWLSIADMSQGKDLLTTKETITAEAASGKLGKLVPPGTLLMSFKLSVGKLGFARVPMFTNEAIMALPVIDKRELLPEYLYYALQVVDLLKDTDRAVMGSTLNKAKLDQIEIPLPPLPEQRRIAAILDKADAIRRKRQEAIRLTEDFLRSVFLDMFGDPVTNPKGWEVKKLENLITVQGGYAFKSSDYVEEGVPLVRIGTANKKDFDLNNIVYLPVSYASTYARFLLEPGDMVITLTGTAGKDDYGNVNIVPDTYSKWLLNQRVAKIKIFNNLITNRYLFTFLSNPNIKDGMICNNRGIRQGNMNNSDILSQFIPLPPMNMQEKFDEIVSKIKSLSSKNTNQFRLSQKFFGSLTHCAFMGEL